MNEIKIEIGDNLKEVMLELLKVSSGEPLDSIRSAVVLREAFNLDFGKILKNLCKRVQIVGR